MLTIPSSFNWFDLNKYDAVKTFDLEDWFNQLDKRQTIHMFGKRNPELIERIHISRWERVNRNANKYIFSIKQNPIFQAEKSNRSILSVRNARVSDISSINSDEILNSLKNDTYMDKYEKLIIPPSVNYRPYDKAMLTIDLGATDEQLKNDFGEWLKTQREIANYKAKEKSITSNDLNKWVNYRVLPYLDLTIIANVEDQTMTHSILGKLLFPEEYNIDVTERIRKIVKPLAEWLLESKSLAALRIQSMAEKKYS